RRSNLYLSTTPTRARRTAIAANVRPVKTRGGEQQMQSKRLEFPESTDEYREGIEARDRGERLQACPYGLHMLYERSLWLAGHHDRDIGIAPRVAA
ncbi:hypothetical protein QOZ34_31810, partial [Pseudomonas aeruginosa]